MSVTVNGEVKAISCEHDFEAGCIRWEFELVSSSAAKMPPSNFVAVVRFATSRHQPLEFFRGDRVEAQGQIEPDDSLPGRKMCIAAWMLRNLSRACVWSEPQ
jgi:hypothetical protein